MRRRSSAKDVLETPTVKTPTEEPTDAEKAYYDKPHKVVPSTTEEKSWLEADVPAKQPAEAPQAKAPETLGVGKNFARIVDFVFSIDINSDFDKIKGKLQLDKLPSQSDYGSLADALDQASENARLAAQVFVIAKSMLDDIQSAKETLDAPMFEAAKQKLQELKSSGTITKQITNGDVESMAIRMFPTELNARAAEFSKAKRTVEYLELLTTRWAERCKDLRQMVASARNI